MRRISGPGALAGGVFTEGNPATNTPATTVTAQFCQDVQEEIAHVVEGSGQVVGADAGANDQLLQGIRTLAAAGGAGDKNLLINGDFQIVQRGPPAAAFGITNAAAITLDRWLVRSDSAGAGAGIATLTRTAHGNGQTYVPGDPTWFARYVQTTAATVGQPMIAQRCEDVRRFASGLLVFSVYLKGSASLACQLRLIQNFGTGGSPSSEVVVATAAISVGSVAFARYAVAVNLTALSLGLSGKTIGTNENSHLRVEILLPQGSTYTIDISDAQLERQASPTSFGRRSPGAELALCQRYYERTGSLTKYFPVNAENLGADYSVYPYLATPNIHVLQRRFTVPKARVPTMRWYNPATSTPDTVAGNGTDQVVSATGNASELSTGYPSLAAAITGSTGQAIPVAAHWTADAEIY